MVNDECMINGIIFVNIYAEDCCVLIILTERQLRLAIYSNIKGNARS